MKNCKTLQIILGILSALITAVLCVFTVFVFVPAIFPVEISGVLHDAYTGIEKIIKHFGLEKLKYVALSVIFLLPAVLMFISTNLVLFATKRKSLNAGVILGWVSFAIFSGFTILFSPEIVGQSSTLMYIVANVGVIAVHVALSVVTMLKARKIVQPQVESTQQTEQTEQQETPVSVEEQPINQQAVVEQLKEQPQSEQQEASPEQAVQQEAQSESEQTTDEQGEVLFMAEDYSSVSEISNHTYDQPKTLSATVLDKLKTLGELYEKGVITKEEYIVLIKKYLDEAE